LRRGERLQAPPPGGGSLIEEQLMQAMQDASTYLIASMPRAIRAASRSTFSFRRRPRGRRAEQAALQPTTYIFVMWMVGSSLVLLAVATIFCATR